MTTLLSGGTRNNQAGDDDVDLARDRELVTRAQAGELAAFDDLYLRYRRRLYRFCLRRLQDSHEAEDVVQEAFARAWRALPSFGGDRRFYPWLSVIAAHLCTDVQRRRSRSTPVAEFHQADVASIEDGGEDAAVAAADHELVAKAFARLSERHQRVLELREGSGWSYQRIADHEGVGITAVETLLWRARQALKREFAAMAGSEGPAGVAAFATGLLSLAGLRRLMRSLGRSVRRVAGAASHGPGVIMGSAAAATALVVAASVSPPSALVPAPQHGATHGAASSALLTPGVGGAAGSSGNVSGVGGNASSSNPSGAGSSSGTGTGPGTGAGSGSGTGAGPGLPTGVGSGLGGLTGTASGTVNGVVNGVTGAVGTLGSAVGTLGSTLNSLGGTASTVVGQVGSTVTGATSTISSEVSPLLSTGAGLLSTGVGDATTATQTATGSGSTSTTTGSNTSSPSSASSDVTKVTSGVGSVVHQVSSTGAEVLGGL